mmetsp:Transcript_57309/g.139755  ORF Transcript_57309/g.139755 Transcript_57309/m.139755 type:complete len:338 (-) Transcript_57309:98-1111(-)
MPYNLLMPLPRHHQQPSLPLHRHWYQLQHLPQLCLRPVPHPSLHLSRHQKHLSRHQDRRNPRLCLQRLFQPMHRPRCHLQRCHRQHCRLTRHPRLQHLLLIQRHPQRQIRLSDRPRNPLSFQQRHLLSMYLLRQSWDLPRNLLHHLPPPIQPRSLLHQPPENLPRNPLRNLPTCPRWSPRRSPRRSQRRSQRRIPRRNRLLRRRLHHPPLKNRQVSLRRNPRPPRRMQNPPRSRHLNRLLHHLPLVNLQARLRRNPRQPRLLQNPLRNRHLNQLRRRRHMSLHLNLQRSRIHVKVYPINAINRNPSSRRIVRIFFYHKLDRPKSNSLAGKYVIEMFW